jgi:hypothetical protein
MTVHPVLLLIVPLSVAIGTIILHLDDITGWIKGLQDFQGAAAAGVAAADPLRRAPG